MLQIRIASNVLLAVATGAYAQGRLQSINLVQPNGKGRVVVPLSDQRKWKTFIFAPGGGPILAMHDDPANLEIVYMLTPNAGTSSKDCLDSVLQHTERGLATGASRADIRQEKISEGTNASGQPLALGSFVIVSGNNIKVPEQYAYAVAATRETCAQMNIRKSDYSSSDDAAIQAAIQQMNFDAGYMPSSQDYFLMGALLARIGHSFSGAATYYQRSLDTLPADAPIDERRATIDQLSIAYDRSGQADRTRSLNEAAIKSDADYPLYYYNLARVDAEDGKTGEAKAHLQQAWNRKANLPAGQQMPDPTQDPSLLKLKNKSDFWSYVQTLK